MKKYLRLHKPEEYTLLDDDIEKVEDFNGLLDHLTDVVNSSPLHKIGLSRIGIGSQKIYITIESLEDPKVYVSMLCEVNTGTDLIENRGIHMSRCLESIFQLSQKKFKSLDDFAVELAKMVKHKQQSNMAFAEVTGTYIHKRFTRKTKLESFDSIQLISKAEINKDKISIKTGVKVHNATSCPCTKTYTKYSVVPKLKALSLTNEQIRNILDVTIAASHMQLGPTILMIDKENSNISHKDLYDVLDKSLHIVYELLKRPDEHEFVESVIRRPQFTEDAARDVAHNAYEAFKTKLSPKAELIVESLLQDSIHTHDVHSLIKKTFQEIKKGLGKSLFSF